ncbi:hypothetical protein [Maribacter litoralis]|uniref:Uncharacterized protein n=1 Tax=Maribacter litoralis TaxID=2059726 RepID=A0A653XRJ5_9FLAO|nr:hypothetical protein [Maribacter litoralis]VXC32775.1 conserved exported hypothetical protein [Maribacter litoralis]
MNKPLNILLLAALVIFQFSCSSDDDDNEASLNPKSFTSCDLGDFSPTSTKVCFNGTDFALPNETITFATEFNARVATITWTIESGSIEIINIEESATDSTLKSIATIKFNSDFNGDAVFKVKAKDSKGSAEFTHVVSLEETN